jgi:hypothetical protein
MQRHTLQIEVDVLADGPLSSIMSGIELVLAERTPDCQVEAVRLLDVIEH